MNPLPMIPIPRRLVFITPRLLAPDKERARFYNAVALANMVVPKSRTPDTPESSGASQRTEMFILSETRSWALHCIDRFGVACEETHVAVAQSGYPVRLSHAASIAGLHTRRDPHPGARHRREHHHFLRHQRCLTAPAALLASGEAGDAGRTLAGISDSFCLLPKLQRFSRRQQLVRNRRRRSALQLHANRVKRTGARRRHDDFSIAAANAGHTANRRPHDSAG